MFLHIRGAGHAHRLVNILPASDTGQKPVPHFKLCLCYTMKYDIFCSRSMAMYHFTKKLTFQLGALLAFATLAPGAAFDSAVSEASIDWDSTGTVVEDIFTEVRPETLMPVLAPAGGSWRAGSARNWKRKAFFYRIAFKQPVAIGTFLASVEGRYSKDPTFRYLKADAPYPGDPLNSEHWETIPAKLRTGYYQHTFPKGFKTRAVTFSEVRPIYSSQINFMLLLKTRMLNITPYCLGQGQQSYGAWWPMDIPHGRRWHGAGTVGEDPVIYRPPVTSIDPSWFILAHDEKFTPVAMRFRSNISDFRLYAFTGDDLENPALTGDEDWERVDYTMVDEKSAQYSMTRLMQIDEKVKSRAYKLALRETVPKESKVAQVYEWTIWEDLGSKAVPGPPEKSAPPPVKVDFEIDKDADVTVVINHPDGTRARNLIAQTEKKAGTAAQAWDLKNEARRYLEVGNYTMKGIYAPPLELYYMHTFYPNSEMHSPNSRPWGGRPQDGWTGNHGNNTGISAVGDRLYMGTSGTEGSHGFIETTLDGVKVRGWSAGVSFLFSDGERLFIQNHSSIGSLDAETGRFETSYKTVTPERRGKHVGWAAHEGRVYVAQFSDIPYFDKATSSRNLEIDHCFPILPVTSDPPGRDHLLPAQPREDFKRLFRLQGEPAGINQPGNLMYIPSTDWASHRQYVVLAFKNPVPIGSVVYPRLMSDEVSMSVSVLKPDAEYPPNPKRGRDWVVFDDSGDKNAWEVLAAPENTMTRALRLTFSKAGSDDLLDEVDETLPGTGGSDLELNEGGDATLNTMLKGDTWKAQLEGMTILRRRFKNLAGSAKIHVNSGTVDKKSGAWIGKPKDLITKDSPGIYAMEWEEKQDLIGLAIREIDGRFTDVQVYVGPDDGPIDFEEADGKNWRHITRFAQKLRGGGQNSLRANGAARYLDGYVNFGTVQKTRAIRLRITSQWPFGAGRRSDLGGGSINHRRCAVYGVAPVAYLGGEYSTGEGLAQSLIAFDWETKELVKELKSPVTGPLAVNSKGELFGVTGQRVVQLDISGDEEAVPMRTFVPDGQLEQPTVMEFGPEDKLYVVDHRPGRKRCYVFDQQGKFSHFIGKPGLPPVGKWDPAYMVEPFDMSISDRGDAYFSYGFDNPRRFIHFKTDGTFVREYLGNTYYGGGCTLDRYDSSIGLYMDMIFEIDWDTHTSKLAGQKSFALLPTTQWGRPHRTHTEVVKVNGRTYHVTIPIIVRPVNPAGFVYLYDEKTYTHRFVAAVGSCNAGYWFSDPEFVELLNGEPPGNFKYIFADRNGDGIMQTDECEITPIDGAAPNLGKFNRDLGIMGKTLRYEVKEFLDDGTPIYHEVPVNYPGGFYRFDNGNYFSYAGDALHGNGYNLMVTPEGKTNWTYKSSWDVSGLYIPASRPGAADNQFAIIGHETEERGDLGEFFVIHANTGQWNVWTVDGMLVGPVLRHVGDPRRGWYGEHKPGARMGHLSAGQEHFHGYFTKTEDDGKYKIINGNDAGTIFEVRGFDRYKRFEKEITVTPEMIAETQLWEAEILSRNLFARAPTVECRPGAPIVDGHLAEGEWNDNWVPAGRVAKFAATYNASRLYFCWTAVRQGPFKNGGDDFRRYFKTGAAVDVQIQTNPDADPERLDPDVGDVRILFANVNGKPKAILYQPNAPDAKDGEGWSTQTYAGGTAAFDRVKELDDVEIAHSGQGDAVFTVEASVPLESLGIKAREDLALKFDWGVMGTHKGRKTIARNYWANEMAVGVTDEPTEARLHPDRWGFLRFLAPKKSDIDVLTGEETQEELQKKDVDDLLDDIEKDLEEDALFPSTSRKTQKKNTFASMPRL